VSAEPALAAEPPTRGVDKSFTYDAFLSYSRRDAAVADGIQKGLHSIARRVGQMRALRVFRDKTDLAASPDLWAKITDALDDSRFLVVVLSPHAATSAWVDREVAYWLQHRGPEHLLLVLADGRLHWDEANLRFDPDGSSAAVPVLTEPGAVATEPVYVDVSDDSPWDAQEHTFRDKVGDIAATIHGKSKAVIVGDDARELRRFRRLRRAAVIGLVMLTVLAVAGGAVAVVQRQEATHQRQEAVHQKRFGGTATQPSGSSEVDLTRRVDAVRCSRRRGRARGRAGPGCTARRAHRGHRWIVHGGDEAPAHAEDHRWVFCRAECRFQPRWHADCVRRRRR
jgi:hypothetical protein